MRITALLAGTGGFVTCKSIANAAEAFRNDVLVNRKTMMESCEGGATCGIRGCKELSKHLPGFQ